jgi:hypothetical protein
MFQLYDLDRDGYVSRDELFFILRTLMGHAVSESHLDKVKPCRAADPCGCSPTEYSASASLCGHIAQDLQLY